MIVFVLFLIILIIALCINLLRLINQLQYHKSVLEGIVEIQEELISTNDFYERVQSVFQKTIDILYLDRVCVFENHLVDNKFVCSLKFEALKDGIDSLINNKNFQKISYQNEPLTRWKAEFEKHRNIEDNTEDFSQEERIFLDSQNVKSILLIPVFSENYLWGFIGFHNCTNKRNWTSVEKRVLQILSNSFISSLMKFKSRKDLENIVQVQNNKIREKDIQMLKQYRLAQMGEMIGMIAHQWRQPLSAITSTCMLLQLKASENKLENDYVEKKVDAISNYAIHLSQTISDFRSFFMPNKEKLTVDFCVMIDSIFELIESSAVTHNIKLTKEFACEGSFKAYANELKQVILSIVKNSEDVLIEREIKNPSIKFKTYTFNEKHILEISDNGGGVSNEIVDKIFDPYFTTREKTSGTGLGLYMSKIITEEHCGGKLTYVPIQEGALFRISI